MISLRPQACRHRVPCFKKHQALVNKFVDKGLVFLLIKGWSKVLTNPMLYNYLCEKVKGIKNPDSSPASNIRERNYRDCAANVYRLWIITKNISIKFSLPKEWRGILNYTKMRIELLCTIAATLNWLNRFILVFLC